MCTRLILCGDFGAQTARAREIMDATGVDYRFEVCTLDVCASPTLLTPGGRFCGLDTIRAMFHRKQTQQESR